MSIGRAVATIAVLSAVIAAAACSGSGNPCANFDTCPNDPASAKSELNAECNEYAKCPGGNSLLSCFVSNEKCTSAGTLDETATSNAAEANCSIPAGFETCIDNIEIEGGVTTNDECGFEGQACCTEGGSACSDGCCDPSTKKCVGEDQACSTAGTTCTVVNGSTAGTCAQCGAAGQACCAGDLCASGCCDDGASPAVCVASGATCASQGTEMTVCSGTDGNCSLCGDIDDPCCPGNTCSTAEGVSVFCDTSNPGSPICNECGGDGEPCCPGNTCMDTDTACLPSTTGGLPECMLCGDVDDPCCPGNVCTDGESVCMAGDGGMQCEACGFSGEPCCSGNQCLDASTCTGGTCM